jgi:hypothetical protein
MAADMPIGGSGSQTLSRAVITKRDLQADASCCVAAPEHRIFAAGCDPGLASRRAQIS